jgi:MFS family permease
MASDTKQGNDAVFLTLSAMGLVAILSSTMSKNPVLKPFATSLGTPDEWTGFVASASTIPGILVSLPAASLSDIFGRKKFLLLAGFVFASAPFLYVLITVWWQLILVRFYHGFATAIFVPVVEASIAELFPTKRGERLSLFSSITYVGRVAAPILGGTILLVSGTSFHTLYLCVAAAGVTAFVTGLLFFREKNAPNPQLNTESAGAVLRKVFGGWGVMVKNSRVLVVCLVQACQYYSFGVVEYYLSGYVQELIRLDWFSTSLITGSLIAVPLVAKPYMGRMSDRAGRRMPIILGCVVCGLPLIVIPFTSVFWVLLLLTMVYGFGFATVTASTPALISEITPKELIGASMGFLDTIMDVGQTFGPIISGFILATALQYYGVFSSLTVVLIFSGAVFAASGIAKGKPVRNP